MSAIGWVAACAFGLLLLEGVSRAAAANEGEQVWLKDLMMQRKVDHMRRLGRSRRVEIAFLGSSTMMCAIDPAILQAEFGIRSYNASIFRGTTSYKVRWGLDFVLPLLRPLTLVVEVYLPTLNDNGGMNEHRTMYEDSRFFQVGVLGRAVFALGAWIATVRVLPILAHPRQLATVTSRMWQRRQFFSLTRPVVLAGVSGSGGESLEHEHTRPIRTGPRLHEALTGQMENWEFGGHEWQQLRHLVSEAGSQGLRVLLLDPPCAEILKRDLFPGGRDGWDRTSEHVRTLARDLDATWVEPAALLSDDTHFADPAHTNVVGKQEFTRALGKALKDMDASGHR